MRKVIIILGLIGSSFLTISVFKERHTLNEFGQTISLSIVSLLFPLGALALLVLPYKLGWLPAVFVSSLCYLPALLISRRQSQALERSGTDRTRKARVAVTQAFVTSVAGIAYIGFFIYDIYWQPF